MEGKKPRSCPLAALPQEILSEVLGQTAVVDVAAFSRLSLVCKRLAYLVATEDRIWKGVCYGHEYGFNAMKYAFTCTIKGAPIPQDDGSDVEVPDMSSLTLSKAVKPELKLPLTPAYPSYLDMFRRRPRVRFTGVYISTVNYVRPGAASPNLVTWNTPVHIVTYYRYLRFYRDGTCISLLTVSEPSDVVPQFTGAKP